MTKFILNGQEVMTSANGTMRLLDILRDEFNLMGTKEGCGEGECGGCSVLFNDLLQNSCLIPVASLQGANIVTIEGYSQSKQYELLSACFSEAGAVQCGFCTPGMMLASEALLVKNPNPTEADVRIAISGNLCRCTGYNMIVEAVLMAAKRGDGLW